MQRRNFLKWSSLLALTGIVPGESVLANTDAIFGDTVAAQQNDRDYWVALMDKIASPVLSNMSRGELRKNMPVEYSPIWDGRNKEVAYMEAFGRLIPGIAPFLA